MVCDAQQEWQMADARFGLERCLFTRTASGRQPNVPNRAEAQNYNVGCRQRLRKS
jgi:hypothetical protein